MSLDTVCLSIYSDISNLISSTPRIFASWRETSVLPTPVGPAKIKDIQNQCMLHPNMKSNYENRSESIIKTKNVGSLKNEKLIPENNFVNTKIAIVSLNDFLENSELREEVFGPFSVIVKCKNLSELLSGLNKLSGQLTATIHSEKEDYTKVNSIINILKNKVGRILFNDFPTGVEVSRSMTHRVEKDDDKPQPFPFGVQNGQRCEKKCGLLLRP